MRQPYTAVTMKAVDATLAKAAALGSAEAKLAVDGLLQRRKWVSAANLITAYRQRGELSEEDAQGLMRRVTVGMKDEETAERN